MMEDERNELRELKEQFDERKRKADESSARRAALSSVSGRLSSGRNAEAGASMPPSRYQNIPPSERAAVTRTLSTSFMEIDASGNIIPKIPEAALLAATTYLMYNAPPAEDARAAAAHRTTMNALTMVGKVLVPDTNVATTATARKK